MADKKNESTNKDLQYDSIKVMEGLPYLRKRAYVNMGSTSSVDGKMPRALIQMAQEILSNSIDEAQSGFGKEIDVIIHNDDSLTVSDHGRGLPRDLKTKNKQGEPETIKFGSAIQAFTKVGASGKFSNDAYGVGTGGLNGIGATATTALSEWVVVEAQTTNHEHYEFRIDYDSFIKDEKPTYAKDLPYDDSLGTFTKVTFKPDKRALDSVDWQVDGLADRYEMAAYLVPKTKITLIDERAKDPENESKPWHKSWYSENGLVDYTKALADGATPVKGLEEPIVFHGEYSINEDRTVGEDRFTGEVTKEHLEGTILIHGALTWIENIGLTTASFANGIPTTEGGPHLDGAVQAITKSVNDYVAKRKLLPRGAILDGNDIRDGLILSIEAKIPENMLQFEGQTKEKLGTGEAKKAAKTIASKAMNKWLYDNEEKAKDLVEKMNESKVAREKQIEARQEAKEARQKKSEAKQQLIVSPKLVKATSKDPLARELFIVEGDSALGPVKTARDAKTQAVFPLRGKILNTADRKLSVALNNTEITTIAAVLGAGIGQAFDVNELEYNKVIILSDADDDGYHIRSLVATLFLRFFPGLIDNGHLFIAEAPLFIISRYEKTSKSSNKKISQYAWSDEERDKIIADLNSQGLKDLKVTRFKGLGENEPMDLKKTVMVPGHRKLIQLTNNNPEYSKQYMQINMGNDADLRRDWVMDNMRFDEADME